MNIKQQLVKTGIALVGLVGFMMLFQPDKLPVIGLIVPFVLLFATFYSLWRLLSMLRARYFGKNGEFAPRKRLAIGVPLTGVLLIVLQSLGQLTLKDVLTVVAILILGYLYLGRSQFVPPKR